jgi:hypothetical protein
MESFFLDTKMSFEGVKIFGDSLETKTSGAVTLNIFYPGSSKLPSKTRVLNNVRNFHPSLVFAYLVKRLHTGRLHMVLL